MKTEKTLEEQRLDIQNAAIERKRRVPLLVEQFDGAIKYEPMLTDHPKWTDDECLAFALKWHAVAVERLAHGEKGWNPDAPELRWNHGIPYCRNDHAKVKP